VVAVLLVVGSARADQKITLKCKGDMMVFGREYPDNEFSVVIDLADKSIHFDNLDFEITATDDQQIQFGKIGFSDGKIDRITGDTTFFMWHGTRPGDAKNYDRADVAKCARAESLF